WPCQTIDNSPGLSASQAKPAPRTRTRRAKTRSRIMYASSALFRGHGAGNHGADGILDRHAAVEGGLVVGRGVPAGLRQGLPFDLRALELAVLQLGLDPGDDRFRRVALDAADGTDADD